MTKIVLFIVVISPILVYIGVKTNSKNILYLVRAKFLILFEKAAKDYVIWKITVYYEARAPMEVIYTIKDLKNLKYVLRRFKILYWKRAIILIKLCQDQLRKKNTMMASP